VAAAGGMIMVLLGEGGVAFRKCLFLCKKTDKLLASCNNLLTTKSSAVTRYVVC